MALKLSYLVNVLMRSSKFVSILLGTLIFKSDGHQDFSKRNVFLAILMTAGIFIFQLGGKRKPSLGTEIVGIVLGMVSLMGDYLTSRYQANVKKQKLTYFDLMLGTNLWCLVFTILMGMVKGEFSESGAFLLAHPLAFWDIVESSFIKMMGVFFIFYHIHIFGPISLAYITTIRKVFTVLLSFWLFNHTLGVMRMIGTGIVFFVIFVDLYDAIKKRKKVKQD